MKTNLIFKLAITGFIFMNINLFAQEKQTIAVAGIDTKNLTVDNQTMNSLVQLELEKTNLYEVLDKYDVMDISSKNEINLYNTFGKSTLVRLGKLVKADKILTGSAEKFGDKITIILRIIDVTGDKIEKANVMEFLNQQEEIQNMVKISINNLLGIQNNANVVDLLINYDKPITSSKTTLKLNGPRMGATYTFGAIKSRMEAPKSEGGLNMFPLSSSFGYQYEIQYLSSGNFQALVEFIPMVNGLESGVFIPSFTFMNGFRFNQYGWEFGVGPVFRLTTKAKGYYNDEGKWVKANEVPENSNYTLVDEIDFRGNSSFTTGLVIAVGKTFKSGYLNIPVNVYVSPRKEGSIVGLTFGFNVAKKAKIK